jgi:hypothetical protein
MTPLAAGKLAKVHGVCCCLCRCGGVEKQEELGRDQMERRGTGDNSMFEFTPIRDARLIVGDTVGKSALGVDIRYLL